MASSDVDDDEHSTYSMHTQKRGLLRAHSGSRTRPIFRNLPLFGFLAGLVIFFYVYYIYQVQYHNLKMMQERFETDHESLNRARDELIRTKISLENKSQSVSNMKEQIAKSNQVVDDHLNQLKKANEQIKVLSDSKLNLTGEITKCLSNISSLNADMETLKSSKKSIDGSESEMAELQKTIIRLKDEIQALKKNISLPAENVQKLQEPNAENVQKLQDPNIPDSKDAKIIQEKSVKSEVENPEGKKEALKEDNIPENANVPEIVKPENENNNVLVPPPAANEEKAIPPDDKTKLVVPGDKGSLKLENILNNRSKAGEINKVSRIGVIDKIIEAKNRNLVVPGGAYIEENQKDVDEKKDEEAAPDFENDEKRIKDPDV